MSHRLISLIAFLGATGNAAAQGSPQLTRTIEYHNPAWRPDSRALLFESTLEGVHSIFAISLDGSGLTRLTGDSANNVQPSWSPDGKRIVFSSDGAGHPDLYLMNADGSGQTRLTTTAGGLYFQASFSPDGRLIVFQGRPDARETRDRVYVVASDGSGLRQLTDSSFGAEGPRWSRDGRTITFLRVPYPKRFWREMTPADAAVARAGGRRMSMRPDGSRLEPAPALLPGDSVPTTPSPNARYTAYTKVVDGWPGLYRYEVATRTERLLTGGPGVGPLGYLRSATLTEVTDTLDTYLSSRGGPIGRDKGALVVRVWRRVGGRRFELSDTWYDSSGRQTARQSVRTGRGTVATELETVRATADSASMLVLPDRVTAWVAPAGAAPRLYDGVAPGERYSTMVVMSAIARRNPAPGSRFLAPVSSLFGPNPVQTQVDTVRVLRRDTLMQGETPLPVLVLERAGGTQVWLEETTGLEVLSRGSAGPTRWWWHIRRGVTPPAQVP